MTAMESRMKIVVTGGAGFIGSALVRHLIGRTDHEVLVVDKLTYAGNLSSLVLVQDHPHYRFSQVDICDRAAIADIFSSFDPDAVVHLAAESHVDRSIDGPADLSIPMSSALMSCWKPRGRIGAGSLAGANKRSAFITSRPMRSMAP